MMHLPNWLILVGTNRNAGKTTLACNIITGFSKEIPVTGIKISPHFHGLEENDRIISRGDEFTIVEETRAHTNKDSSRMLTAGADRVFYIQAWDNNLEKAVRELLDHIDPISPVICESGWIRNFIEPGIFLILSGVENTDTKGSILKLEGLDHHRVKFDGKGFDLDLDTLSFTGNRWVIR